MQETSTFRTFAGNIDLLKETKPLWAILENIDMSDGPGSESDSSTAVISRMLSDANYTCRVSQALKNMVRHDQNGTV